MDLSDQKNICNAPLPLMDKPSICTAARVFYEAVENLYVVS